MIVIYLMLSNNRFRNFTVLKFIDTNFSFEKTVIISAFKIMSSIDEKFKYFHDWKSYRNL